MDARILDDYRGYRPTVHDLPAGLSFAGAVAALLNYAGCAVSYPYLAGLTGEAFKSHYRYDDYRVCFASEMDLLEAAAAGTGVRFAVGSGGTLDEAWARVRASIDAGRPVLTSHLEALVIAGYRDRTVVFADEVFHPGERQEMPLDEFAKIWSAWYPGGPKMERYLTITVAEVGAMPDRRAVASRALKQALALSRPHAGPNGAQAGTAAYSAFAADLRNTPAKDFAQSREWLGFATVDHLADSKLAAAAFLREIADDLPPTARPHAARIASLYGEEHHWWSEWRRLTDPFDPADHPARALAADFILNCARCEKQVVLELEAAAREA